MSIPAELHYTPEHEWMSVDGTSVSVGITDYAAQQLGDVVYISLPALGATVCAGEPCGGCRSPGNRPGDEFRGRRQSLLAERQSLGGAGCGS
jgi:hypothetical protein